VTQRAAAGSGVLEERFKVSLNTAIPERQGTEDPVAKRKNARDFLIRMDQGIGMAKGAVSEKDGRNIGCSAAENAGGLRRAHRARNYKSARCQSEQLRQFCPADVEQADQVIYISVGGIIIILLILLLLFR